MVRGFVRAKRVEKTGGMGGRREVPPVLALAYLRFSDLSSARNEFYFIRFRFKGMLLWPFHRVYNRGFWSSLMRYKKTGRHVKVGLCIFSCTSLTAITLRMQCLTYMTLS